MIEDSGVDEEIPLPNVKSAILQKVIDYCTHYSESNPPEIEKPLKSAFMHDVVPSWDSAFVDIE